MSAEKLHKAIASIKAGNKSAAIPLLREILQADPNNETAWTWLYASVDQVDQKRYCLQQVLKINPDNQNARAALIKIDRHALAQTPQPSAQKHRSAIQEAVAPQQQRDAFRSAPKTHTNSNRTIYWLGSAALVLLICAALGIAGYWVYQNSLSNNQFTVN